MRIFVEKSDGSWEPLGELTGISDSTQLLIFRVKVHMRKEDRDALENDLKRKSGKTCLVLGPEFEHVIGTK